MRSRRLLGVTLAAAAALALALSAGAAADNDTGAKLSVTIADGSVLLSATSTAASVQFTADDTVLGSVPVTDGAAEFSVATWGYPNGTHTASVRDCVNGECTGNGMAASFTVANAAPAITTPADDASILGGFTIAARSPGASLQLVLDGRSAGYADGPDFTFPRTGTALPPGKHAIQVHECTSDHSRCAGPASPVVHVTSQALHPLVSVSSAALSPNGDGVRDTTSVRFQLARTESVVLSALDSTGTTVERHPAKTFSKGVHHWEWRGLGRHHKRVPDGTYTLQVASSAVVRGATVQGSSRRTVQVDTRAPSIRTTGGGSVVYPHPDGYHDTFTPHLTLSEPAHLRLVVRNARHQVVGVGTAHGSAGATSVTWNGRTNLGRVAPPGRDTWTVTATDAAGNRSRTAPRKLTVSTRRLVKRAVTLTKNGADYAAPQVSSGCGSTSTSSSL